MNDALAAGARDARPAPSRRRRAYLAGLAWSFNAFNSVRVFAYLPNVLAIIDSGDSRQHSLWTWLILMGANLTMSAWLYEHNEQRVNRAVSVSIGNALMCCLTAAVIVAYRF